MSAAEQTSLPLRATMGAALRDVFGRFAVFLRVVSMLWLCTLVCVDVPSLFLSQAISRSVAAELEKKGGAAPATEKPAEEKAIPQLTREEMRRAIKLEYMLANMGLSLLQSVFIISFVVGWYRVLLTGERQGHILWPRLGRREWDYAWVSMKVGLVLAPLFIIIFGFVAASMPEFVAESGGQDLGKAAPVLVVGLLLMLYLQARLTMCYPLSVLGESQSVLKKSWKMTARHAFKIIAGSVLVSLPVLLLMGGVITGVAWLLRAVGLEVHAGQAGDLAPPSFDVASLVLRGLGGFFTLVLLAVLTAFHARLYAFFVRAGTKS